jgi:hypothetical protein
VFLHGRQRFKHFASTAGVLQHSTPLTRSLLHRTSW